MKLFVLPQNGVIAPFPEPGAAFGHVQSGNPFLKPPELVGPGRTVLFSGRLEDDGAGWTNWGPRVWERFGACCDQLGDKAAGTKVTICFRPRAADVLCDPSACVAFLDSRRDEPFELLLDASAFLTAQMVGDAQDHLIRAYEMLAHRERVVGVILANVAGDDQVPLHKGELDAQLLITTWASHCPAELPVLILDDEPEAQARLFD